MTLLGVPLPTLLGAGAAITTALVALYLLRPPRRRILVPYARLWGVVTKDQREQAPAQTIARRLRRLDSLLLQLLIAALILFALADPHPGKSDGRPRHVLLVDTSASMQARETKLSSTRIDKARDAVSRAIDALEPEEEAMIVAFDTRAHALSALTSSDAELRAAASRIVASDSPTALGPALRLAADALRGAPRSRITIIGDGAYDAEEHLELPDADVRFVNVSGEHPDNLAITGFSVRRYPANPSAYELLVEVRSNSDRPRRCKLTVRQEGEPVDVQTLELPPNGALQRRLTDLSGDGQHLEAVLEPDGFDALPLDDHAYSLLSDRRRTRVLLVGEGDLYAEGALLLDRSVDVDRLASAKYDATSLDRYDAIVFDGFSPPSPPAKPALYLGCPGPCPFTVKGDMAAPIVTEVDRAHAILKWVALKDLNVSRTRTFAPERGDTSLAGALGKTIFIAGERNGHKLVALGFPPSQSDLPLRVAFPVLLVNTLKWLSSRSSDVTDELRTGRSTRLPASANAILTSPEGASITLPMRDGTVDVTVDRVGFYTLADRPVAANLADPRESQLASRPLVIGGRTIPPPTTIARLRPRASLWRWLVLAALLLVLLEWHTYHRRWTV